MAVNKLGPERWQSSLTGQTYTSEQAARHYDTLEAQSIRAGQDPGEAILSKLSTEELKSVTESMIRRADEAASRPDGVASITEWLANTPAYIDEGLAGAQNSGALKAHLRSQGLFPPYSSSQLHKAYSNLVELGVLHLKPGVDAKVDSFDEAAAYRLPLSELKRRAGGNDGGF
jgi:hypothetical protein